jgi:hypothetical protein
MVSNVVLLGLSFAAHIYSLLTPESISGMVQLEESKADGVDRK